MQGSGCRVQGAGCRVYHAGLAAAGEGGEGHVEHERDRDRVVVAWEGLVVDHLLRGWRLMKKREEC